MSNQTKTDRSLLAPLIIIELSEFSVDLLTQAVSLHPLPNIAKILQFKKSSYKTNDRYNSGHLEPATQWRSVHTGVPTRQHSPDSKYYWQILNNHNVTTLDSSLAFPGPYTKIYLLKTAFKLGCFWKILREIIQSRKKNKNPFQKIAWTDKITTQLFYKLKQKQNPQCSVLFLESLSYCQHHDWHDDLSNNMIDNLKTLDKIFELLFTQFPNDSLIIHNALSQIKSQPTSRRIPLGTVYSQHISFPNHIFNHEFNNYIYHYFAPEKFKLKSEYIEDEMEVI